MLVSAAESDSVTTSCSKQKLNAWFAKCGEGSFCSRLGPGQSENAFLYVINIVGRLHSFLQSSLLSSVFQVSMADPILP